uniref:Uncharacterized protein n=1 Tax=Leersia perrieri TaxID=77586 RepID=A0A0D9X317_9ORYZ
MDYVRKIVEQSKSAKPTSTPQPRYGETQTCQASGTTSDSPRKSGMNQNSKPQGDDKGEKSLSIPKTLPIDDPDEAAKNSIWTTLGIEPGGRAMDVQTIPVEI